MLARLGQDLTLFDLRLSGLKVSLKKKRYQFDKKIKNIKDIKNIKIIKIHFCQKLKNKIFVKK